MTRRPAPEIRELTNTSPEFYPLIGPFLARRDIVAELGGHLWDDDDKTWFVAIQGDREVIGFCAARSAPGGKTTFQSAYVLPPHRRHGVYRRLWKARRKRFPGPAQATCTASALGMFTAQGWTVTGERGRYRRAASPQ
jgi:GNAT superfamily N-acetyltransferase